MEVASLVIKAAGIRVIIAKSFARTFYRNAINGGLLPIEADTDSITNEDQLRIVVEGSNITIHNLTKSLTVTASAPGGIILEIFEAGGLVNYIRSTGDFPSCFNMLDRTAYGFSDFAPYGIIFTAPVTMIR